jgi:hypothetical protein
VRRERWGVRGTADSSKCGYRQAPNGQDRFGDSIRDRSLASRQRVTEDILLHLFQCRLSADEEQLVHDLSAAITLGSKAQCEHCARPSRAASDSQRRWR